MAADLDPVLAEIAERELGETPEKRQVALASLRARIEQLPPEQRPHRTDDSWLLAYLRGTKYREDDAVKKLLAMAAFRREHPELTESASAEEFRELYDSGFMRILSGYARNGCLVSCLLPAKMGELKDPQQLLRWTLWCTEQVLDDPHLQVCGMLIIENFEGFSLAGAIRMNHSIPQDVMRMSFKIQQECLPVRIRGIFVLHQPAYMTFLWTLVRPFMKKKLRDRVHFFGSKVEAFREYIAPEYLPAEFGGTLQEDPSTWISARCLTNPSLQE